MNLARLNTSSSSQLSSVNLKKGLMRKLCLTIHQLLFYEFFGSFSHETAHSIYDSHRNIFIVIDQPDFIVNIGDFEVKMNYLLQAC